MIVAIPSKGRTGKVTSLRQIEDAFLFVPRSEAAAYATTYPETEVVPVPATVRGITATRNFILTWAIAKGDPYVVFVDDDLRTAGWLRVDEERMKVKRLTEAETFEEWQKLFDLTEQVGYRVWGVATLSAPRAYYPYRPFLWHSYVTASCMGVLAHSGIRFDETFPVKEDYEMCLRCIKEDGGIVAARFFFWENSHWTDAGGCKEYRSQGMELDCIKRLMTKYPGMIRRVERGGSGYSIDLEF